MNDNVKEEFLSIINNIPSNLSEIEKVRYLYIKLGRLFCYNYMIVIDKELVPELDLNSSFLCRYQTCKQLSQIFDYALKINHIVSLIMNHQK